jgi:cytochrome b
MNKQTSEQNHAKAEVQSKMVWDLPVRVFHWSLVLLFFTAWFTGEDDRWLDIHIFAGYAILALIVFRFAWGFSGTHFARFKQFSYSFSEAWDYVLKALKGHPPRYIGHNPAGSWAIYLLLLGIFLVVFSGFFVFGGEEGHGPAASLVSNPLGWIAKNIHNGLATAMMTLVAVHVAGVVFESYHLKEKLVLSMINGRKLVSENIPEVSPRKGVAVAMVTILLLYLLSAGIGLIPGKEAFESQFTGQPLATLDVWEEECGSCHLPYHPSLLPASSWVALMKKQDEHFGEDLMIDGEVINQLTDFAIANSAEHGETEAARKIMDRMKPSLTPLRISETRYWLDKHEEIADETWQQSNVNGKGQCDACHSDAMQGWFEDSKMTIPDAPQK